MFNQRFLLLGVVFLFLSLMLSGCEDLDIPIGDTIEVNITATASVFNASDPVPNIQVRFDFEKTNGESFTLYRYTDYDGVAVVSGVGYNLQKSQSCRVEVSLPGTGVSSVWEELHYYQVKNEVISDYYVWRPELEIIMDE